MWSVFNTIIDVKAKVVRRIMREVAIRISPGRRRAEATRGGPETQARVLVAHILR